MYRFGLPAILLLTLYISAGRVQAQTPIPSFPGAIGFGGTASGAWTVSASGTSHMGGTVYHVTNLNDSGAGSFRTGVGTSGNIVVFDVGGSIQSLTPVTIASNVSIEGQTAPGGIQVFGAEASLYGRSNIICRYMHFRDGTEDALYKNPSAVPSSSENAANLGSCTNVIMDHCCFEFAAYNNIDATAAVNITIQNCIFADPIAEQEFNCHIETGPDTFYQNLWANSGGRNPLLKADAQFLNNIVYNYGFAMTTGNSGVVVNWDVINNYFITGPNNTDANDTYYQIDDNQSVYASGNYEDSSNNGTLTGSQNNSVGSALVLSSPAYSNSASLASLTAQQAFYDVVSTAGPLPRDQVDGQVVSQVLSLGLAGMRWENQTATGFGNDGYGVITGQQALPDSDASGMPDDWKSANGLSLTNPAISGSTSSTGYTYLENYLNWKALPNAWVAKNTSAVPTSLSIDLSQYANGFGTGSGVTYSTSNVTGGALTQSSSMPWLVTYTPTVNTSGLGGFKWSVANSTVIMSSTFGVLISTTGPSQSVIWKGDGVHNNWDTTSSNWAVASTGSATTFITGDPVTFDDTGSASPSINISYPVSPGNMTVNTYANNYTLSGTGTIGGIGSLVKEGTGTFTLNSGINSYSGGTQINSGILVCGTVTALSSGAITLNGGELELTNGGTINNTIVANEPSTLNVINANVTLTGAESGNAALSLTIPTGTVCSVQASWPYSGTLTLSNGGELRFNNGTNGTGSGTVWCLPNAVVNLNGPVTLRTRYNSTTAGSGTYGALEGISGSVLEGSDQTSSSGGTFTYVVGTLGLSSTFAGSIQDSSGEHIAITKAGAGTWTLSGTSSNTGATVVSAGTLVLTGTLGNTAVTVDNGATFVSNSLVSGSLVLDADGSIDPGSATPGAIGTLTLGSGLGIVGGAGANLNYDLSDSPAASGSNDLITVNSGSVSLSGTIDFNINMTNGTLGAGTYPLINGNATMEIPSGSPTLTALLPLPAGYVTRQSVTVQRTGSGSVAAVNLVVTGSAASIVWSGTNGAIWDLDNTLDWSPVASGSFFDLDTVNFDDSDAGGNVTISGQLQPYAINVISNVSNYNFTGSGMITGSTQLFKSGSGTLTIGNVNTFIGGVYDNGGTLAINSDNSLGSSTIYLNGGTLELPAYPYFLNNSVAVTADSTILSSSSSNFLVNSNSTLTSTTSAITLVVSLGNNVCTMNGSMAGFEGIFEIGSSTGTLRLNNTASSLALFDLGSASAVLGNLNGAAADNFGAIEGGPATTLSGRLNGSGGTSSTYTVGALNLTTTFAGAISNAGDLQGLNITKVGTGNWILSGTSTFNGNMLIQQGTLTISGSDNNGGLDFETQTGATLALAGGAITTLSLQIDTGATFTGNGTVNASYVNQGAANITGGAPLTVNGDFENDGTLTVGGTSSLVINLPAGNSTFVNTGAITVNGSSTLTVNVAPGWTGSFVNNGFLDIMDSPQSALPPGYINNGTILTSSLVTVQAYSLSGSSFSLTIQSYVGHTYQLQESTDLSTWINVGSPVTGNGSGITLTDPNATSAGMIYRIGVGP